MRNYVIDDNVTFEEFSIFFKKNGDDFIPPLLERIDLCDYYAKISHNGKILKCKYKEDIVGIICFYCNNLEQLIAYITILAIDFDYRGHGIAKILLNEASRISKAKNMKNIEIHTNNKIAYHCYVKNGFNLINADVKNNYVRYYLTKKL